MAIITYIKYIFFVCPGIHANSKLSAQDVKFDQLSINDGLSQNAVFTVLEDSKGINIYINS